MAMPALRGRPSEPSWHCSTWHECRFSQPSHRHCLPRRRDPCAYWREALARDPGDARCNAALGARHLRRGEWGAAEARLRAAAGRLTARNPNPADGEALYLLGLALRWQGVERQGEAHEALYKATWNYAWRSAAHYALAQARALCMLRSTSAGMRRGSGGGRCGRAVGGQAAAGWY